MLNVSQFKQYVVVPGADCPIPMSNVSGRDPNPSHVLVVAIEIVAHMLACCYCRPGTKPSSKNVLENSFSNRQHADLVCGLSNYPGFGLAQGLREWLVTKLVKDLPPQRQPGKGVRSEVGKITPCNCSGALGDAATGKVASNICWCMLSRPNGPERFDQAEFSRLVQVIPLPLRFVYLCWSRSPRIFARVCFAHCVSMTSISCLSPFLVVLPCSWCRHRFVPELRGLSHANAQEELVERPAGSLLKQNMMTLAQLIPLQNRFPSVAGYIELVRAQVSAAARRASRLRLSFGDCTVSVGALFIFKRVHDCVLCGG